MNTTNVSQLRRDVCISHSVYLIEEGKKKRKNSYLNEGLHLLNDAFTTNETFT